MAWVRIWLVLFTVAFGTNVPTPLLLRYRADLGLSPTALTAIFGVYAAGLLPALLLAGPASDRHGRRPVTVPWVVFSAVTSALFIPAVSSVPLLYAGRFLQGVVSGVVFSVGSAWLAELIDDPDTAARRATIALSLGWALGPFASGLLAQYGPAPTTLPYLVHLALMVIGIAAALTSPESLIRKRAAPLVDIGIPPGSGEAFARFVVPVALGVFTMPAVAVTVLPLLLQRAMTGVDLAVTGVVAAVTMVAGVLAQPLGRRLGALRAGPAGLGLGALGLVVSLAASGLSAWPLLIPAAVLLGAGYGLCLVSGLTVTDWLAAADARGALTASFYACAYLGFATPLLLSAAGGDRGFGPPLAVLAVVLGAAGGLLYRGRARQAVTEARRPRDEALADTCA